MAANPYRLAAALTLFAGAVHLSSREVRAGEAAAAVPSQMPAFRVGGRDMTCTDLHGRSVRAYTVAGLGDAGFSEIFFRMPVIKIDPDVIARLPDKMQVFFFLHECGHHKLGHLLNRAETAEPDADCWAIKTGRDASLFSREDVASFKPFIEKSSGSRAGHLPGPERHAFLLSCFDAP